MSTDSYYNLRHIVVRVEDSESLKRLEAIWRSLREFGLTVAHQTIPLDLPDTLGGHIPNPFKMLVYAQHTKELPDSSPVSSAYIYRYADVVGLVLLYHNSLTLPEPATISVKNALGNVRIQLGIGEAETTETITDTLWKLPFADDAAADRALFFWGERTPPPLLRAQVWGFKLHNSFMEFQEFLEPVGMARQTLKEQLATLEGQGYLDRNTQAQIPTTALLPVQQAEAALGLAESQLASATTGAKIAADNLAQSADHPPAVREWIAALTQKAEYLERQLGIERSYNAAARLASDALKPLATSIRALSQERLQEEQNHLAEARNRLTIVGAATTGFVVTWLAAVPTFKELLQGQSTYWPSILTASVVVSMIPVITGRWADHQFRCGWVRFAAAIVFGFLCWVLGSFMHWTFAGLYAILSFLGSLVFLLLITKHKQHPQQPDALPASLLLQETERTDNHKMASPERSMDVLRQTYTEQSSSPEAKQILKHGNTEGNERK